MPAHRCTPSPDPRRQGACACGREPEVERRPLRDREFEDRCTQETCIGIHVNTTVLSSFAGTRADRFATTYGSGFPALDRNLEMEALEELADARNYIVWRLDGINRGLFPGQEWKIAELQLALRSVAMGFEQLRSLLSDEQ